MALARHASFLLTALGLYLGLFLTTVETASCPAASVNVSEVCGHIESNDVRISANLTDLVCDNIQHLSQFNQTFILQALEYGLRKRNEVPLEIVKVLFNQADGEELNMALEEFNHKIVNSSLILLNWKTIILSALWDEKLRNEDRFNDTAFVTSWFQKRLRPFISAISSDMLRCLHNETMQCNQYQAIVKGLDLEFEKMSLRTQEDIFNTFQLLYLKELNSNGSACTENLNSSSWLTVNFGRFSRYARYQDFVSLNSRLNVLDVLKHLTVKQLGQLSATGGALKTLRDVKNLMGSIETSTLTEYIDEFNRQANASLPKEIQAGLLKYVLAAAQPIFQEADDAEFMLWMRRRLPGLIQGMNSSLVPLLFDPLENRNCSALSAVVTLLNSAFGEFSNATGKSIYEAILTVISNSSLRCYSSNVSFSVYLGQTFQGFSDFLTLRDLETLIPKSHLQKIVNTIAPVSLADLFSREGFFNDNPFLTILLRNYKKNGLFVDKFNQKDIIDILPNDTKTAILAGVWLSVVSSSNNTEVDAWFDRRLTPYFMFLNGNMMNSSETLNASCVTFHKIVRQLNENIGKFKGKEEEVYDSIKAYLTATKARPRCYNASDPGSSGWLVTYLGSYIHFSSTRDMRLLTNNSAAIFQEMAFNRDNLELINQNKIHKGLAEMFANALFTFDSDFSLDSLPDQLICFAQRSARISSLNSDEALSFIARVNLHCSSSTPSASDRQLATMLMAQVKTFDKQTLAVLGQQAMGLTMGQISNLTAQDLVDPKVLDSLGQVIGWNRAQAQMLVNKILLSNFKLDAAEKFERFGTLAQGLPSNGFDAISADSAIELAKNASFLRALGHGPEHLKKAFVNKILSNSSSPSDILNNIPDELADQVPNSLLVFGNKIPDLRKISEKRWSPQQAAVLFADVLSRTDNYTELSKFILQGFQCKAAGKLIPGQLSSLVQAVKSKNANLNDEQLSCMARLLTRSNLTANFTSYPPDLLLFFVLSKVDHQSCAAFYSLASQGNLTLLANRSIQRASLLRNALSCFGVVNVSLSKEQLQNLGAFVCDMDATTIRDSDPGILENLKRCSDLTASQRTALNILLSSGKSLYGAPASWGDGTLEGLGPLAFYINSSTWGSIGKEERMIFFKNVVNTYHSQSASQKEKIALFLKSIGPKHTSSPRAKRAPETCQSAPITAGALEDPLFIIHYDRAQQFDACLSNEVLKDNLAALLEQPLPNDYLAVIKRKLDEVYPNGIPEDQLKVLGFLALQYSAGEIAKWNVTSRDTLAALLSPRNGAWGMTQLKALVARYTELGGTLTGPLLNILEGKYLCFLDEHQLNQISPESIRHTEKLDISSCSQSKKNLLYEKAEAAFTSQNGTSAYYPLIQPYLGGAPAEDLRKLARSQLDMDINTFTNLNSKELQKLGVQDVKSLLGVNLPDLKEAENHPSVAMWIKSHFQSELDTLGIGLKGGMTSVSSTEGSSTVPSASITAERNDILSTVASSMEIATSAISNRATSSNNAASFSSSRLNISIPRAAPDVHSTPLLKITTVSNEMSTSIDTTNASLPTISTEHRFSFSTRTPAVSSLIAATSNNPVSGTAALATPREIMAATSGKVVADSSSNSTNGTDLPAISIDSNTTFPTEITATSSNVMATSDDTISRTPVPTATRNSDITTSSKIVAHFNSTMSDITVLPTTTINSTAAVPTKIIASSSNISSTSTNTFNGVPMPTTGTETTTNTSDKTTAALNATIANSHTTLPTIVPDSSVTPATDATISHMLAINRSPTSSATMITHSIASPMPRVTVLSSESPTEPPQPMPNATRPAPISTATETADKTGTASIRTGAGAATQAATEAATVTRRAISKTPPRTKPPSHPTPNGYINIQPLSASPSNTLLSWPLLTLSLVFGTLVQQRLP